MKRLTVFIIASLALLVGAAAMAEDLTDRWGVGLNAGMMKLVGGDHDYASVDEFGGLWIRRGFTPHWSLDMGAKIGNWHQGVGFPGEAAEITFDSFGNDYTKMWQAMIGTRYNLNPDSRLNPYFGAHLGMMKWRVVDDDASNELGFDREDDTLVGYNYDGEPRELKTTNMTATATFGAEYFFTPSVSMDLGARFNWLISNDLDNIGTSAVWGYGEQDANDGMAEAFLGLTYYFGGGAGDKDGDGILDGDDACPDDPEDMDGYMDKDGCPDLDNDGDGILDGDDRCPNEAEDLDGYMDADGCPDADNDGDGILDGRDACPNEAETVNGFEDEDGCPEGDADGDGVADAKDECPDTPAGVRVNEVGCPEAEARTLTFHDVNFEFNKATLTPASTAILDDVVSSLEAFDTITIEIRGHTDNVGGNEYNLRLSQARAESVMNYMAGKGIARDRMRAVGFGEEKPIADNATEEGRAQNRRVEMIPD